MYTCYFNSNLVAQNNCYQVALTTYNFYYSKKQEMKFIISKKNSVKHPAVKKEPCSSSSKKNESVMQKQNMKEEASWIRLLNIYYERAAYLSSSWYYILLEGWEKRKSDKTCGTCSCSLSASVLLLRLLKTYQVTCIIWDANTLFQISLKNRSCYVIYNLPRKIV